LNKVSNGTVRASERLTAQGRAYLRIGAALVLGLGMTGVAGCSSQPTRSNTPVANLTASDVDLASLDEPITRSELPLNRRFALNLADFALKKGDRLRLTLEVTDFRGKLAGRSSLSEPLLLDISDESGVLAAISEADIRSEQWLTDLINRQMGVGKAPLESIAPETDSTTSEKRDDG